MKLGIILVLVAVTVTHCAHYNDPSGCVGVEDEPHAVKCNSIPVCSSVNHLFYRRYEQYYFEPVEDTLKNNIFENCTFTDGLIVIKDIKRIEQFAFSTVKIATNSQFKLKISATKPGSTDLFIDKYAFTGMRIMKNGVFTFQVNSYKEVILEDALINSVHQEINSKLNVVCFNVEELVVTDKNNNETNSFINNHRSHFTHNRTYSLEVSLSNSVHITENMFKGLQITPYSLMEIKLQSILNVHVLGGAFERLQIGDFANFTIVIDNVNSVRLGEDLFSYLQQEVSSIFNLRLTRIGAHKTSDNYDYYNDLYDYQYDDNLVYELPESDWFCIPNGLLKKSVQAESSLTKIEFDEFESSVSVSAFAFHDIQMSDSSKLQIIMNKVKGHIIVDTNAFYFIRINDGIFEFWVKNHRQDQVFYTEQRGSQLIAADNPKSNFKPKNIEDNLLGGLENIYLKLNDLAFNKLFLSSRSFFRFGYVNCKSGFTVYPKSFNSFHTDQIQKKDLDERTKISFELSQIEDDNELGFQFEFLDKNTIEFNADLMYMPKVIEIESYEPSLSVIHLKNSTLTKSRVISVGNELGKGYHGEKRQVCEFCRFYRTRPLMTPVEFNTPNLINSNSLVYFSEPIKISLGMEKNNEPVHCTSCLYIYLYRTMHRREDFFFVKDHLPSCFLNLHYKDNLYFSSYHDTNKRLAAIKTIESTFKEYWSLLNCAAVTGLNEILTYHNNDIISGDYNGDETYTDLERIDRNCKRKCPNELEIKRVKNLNQANFHKFSQGICPKNSDMKQDVRTALKKSRGNNQSNNESKGSFNWTLLLVSCLIISIVAGLIIWRKNKYSNEPFFVQLHSIQRGFSNLGTKSSFKKLEINNNRAENDTNEFIGDVDLNEYEYDDDFDFSKTETTSFQRCDLSDNEESVVINQSLSSKKRYSIQTRMENIFNKTNLLNVANPKFSKKSTRNFKYPHCSYNTQDTTLVATKIPNEFKLELNEFAEASDSKKRSCVTYDIDKKEWRQSLIANEEVIIGDGYGYDQNDATFLRVEENPLDNIKFNSNE